MSVSRIERLFDTHAKPGALVAYNDKGTRLAILGKVGMPNAERVEVMIWDTETDRLVHSPIGDNEEVSALAFAPGGNLLLITSDKMARIWNTDSGKLERSRPIEDKVTSVTFSADGRLLAAAQSGGSLRLWDFEGKQIRELEIVESPVLWP